MNEVITWFSAVVGTVSSAGWIVERRKRNALAVSVETDNEGKNIDNQGKAVELYQAMLDDLGTRYENKYKEVETLYQRKVAVLESEIDFHKKVNESLREEILQLRGSN